MAEILDINHLNSGFTNVKIGRLTKEVISQLNINRSECDIILWNDRYEYIQKHIPNFKSKEDFDKHIALIPDIIENPDYIGKHPNDNSIQYIKRINELMIVAIRVKEKGHLALRSAYPLREKQLENYIESGTAWKYKKGIDNSE